MPYPIKTEVEINHPDLLSSLYNWIILCLGSVRNRKKSVCIKCGCHFTYLFEIKYIKDQKSLRGGYEERKGVKNLRVAPRKPGGNN